MSPLIKLITAGSLMFAMLMMQPGMVFATDAEDWKKELERALEGSKRVEPLSFSSKSKVEKAIKGGQAGSSEIGIERLQKNQERFVRQRLDDIIIRDENGN